MSNHDFYIGSHGRSSHEIPAYDPNDPYKQQRPKPQHYMPRPRTQRQDRSHIRDYSSEQYGSYYVEDTPSQPLSPTRSHLARPDVDSEREPPPARPLRPNHPPVTDYAPSPQQRRHQMYQQFFEDSPTHHGNGQWTENGYASPGASRQSQGLQGLINQLQRRAPLGPPPSARRNPPSYYQQHTPHVHPIVEETDSIKGSTHHGSIKSVSSNTNVPTTRPSHYYRDDSSSIYSGVPSMPPSLHPVRDSQFSPVVSSLDGLHRPDSLVDGLDAVIQDASDGMQTKTRTTTLRSPTQSGQDDASEDETPERRKFPLTGPSEREEIRTPPDLRSGAQNPNAQGQLYSQPQGGNSDAGGVAPDVPVSESDRQDALRKTAPLHTTTTSPLVPPEFREDYVSVATTPVPSSVPRKGRRRPPHLDMDAVREAEHRGSLTSLPDLIKRATRLASNLDRGKTASRLGMSAWLSDTGYDSEKAKSGISTATNNRRSLNSLTDMLASFPPPAVGTPPHSRHRGFSTWSSNNRHSSRLRSQSDLGKEQAHQEQPASERPKKRGCCGMPLWLIILLIIIGICLIAAAIVVPVVLVVIPQQRNANPPANTTSICQQSYSCHNGGASILATNGNCQCLCINGFTGSTCTDQDHTGCYTVSIGNTSDITVGSSIPRIINDAYTNFSIPLDSSTLLGLFSSAALSCTVENALITFNGLAQRDVIERRQATASADAAMTSDGVVFQAGSPTPSTTLATMTSTTSAASGTSSSFPVDNTTLDFARTAVLFVFQATGSFNSSYAAQLNFQRFFSSTSGSLAKPNSLGLGSGYSADLSSFHLTLANGSVVGGGSGHA